MNMNKLIKEDTNDTASVKEAWTNSISSLTRRFEVGLVGGIATYLAGVPGPLVMLGVAAIAGYGIKQLINTGNMLSELASKNMLNTKQIEYLKNVGARQQHVASPAASPAAQALTGPGENAQHIDRDLILTSARPIVLDNSDKTTEITSSSLSI